MNEGGDKTLAQRREVIKRVSEFEDFSTCYENDRYKAQGLVAQILKVVNVKDSFTRMNLEREKERKERQAAYTASVEAKQKEAARNARPSKIRFTNCSPKQTRTSGESNLRASSTACFPSRVFSSGGVHPQGRRGTGNHRAD